MSSLIHPDLLTSLHDFFPALCTIQQGMPSEDAAGEEQLAWADLAGHVNLRCHVAPAKGAEVRTPDMTYVVASHTIALAGNYPTIQEKMRALVGGKTYDILLVEWDSLGKTTYLSTQIVT